MQKTLYPRDDEDKLYVSRKGGRGFAKIKDSFNPSIQPLEDYIKKTAEENWLQWLETIQTTQASTEQK